MNPLIREVDQRTREVDQHTRTFFEQVDSAMSWVPAPLEHLVDPIVRNMALLHKRLRDFWDRVEQLNGQRGDSDRLKQVGEQWVSRVGDVLGDIAGTIGADRLRTTIEWEGRAARAYQSTVPPQAAGLNAVKDIAGQMRSSLTSLANSIDMFWIAMGIALTTFVVGILAAVGAAVTIVGIPAAIAALIGAAGVTIGLISATIVAMESHVNTIEVEQAAIRQKVRDLGSTWAMPNTGDLTDASTADGDGSDWRPSP
ncbi:hypothetical protein [Saccharothrix yanglingensis]|uniref:WXG100 family type VII secretion target n=1 Tax=Saccharothrix yanglingensis TaxID=659496 RepID=A0ABU0X977_9PSEU|nr:hypothetical protein [Saccharothrix yanglingensis]MDQ2588683.1 hypothetical protein [Saccharothrix yanglingensis]